MPRAPDPADTEPAGTEPLTTEPASTEPARTQPAASDPPGPPRPTGPPRIEVLPPAPGGPRADPRTTPWSHPAWPLRPAPPPPAPPRWGLALLLLAVTFVTTTTMGAVWTLYFSTTELAELDLVLTPGTLLEVWRTPALLVPGLAFSLPALFILLCHEAGHYVACRIYRLPSTVPYFLPLPLGLGTLGAFIRIRAPIRRKRALFDVGIAGPIAGFVALLPFLILGIAWSNPVPVDELQRQALPTLLLIPGDSLAMRLTTWAFHGPLDSPLLSALQSPLGWLARFGPQDLGAQGLGTATGAPAPGVDTVLELHPFALAAWFGLLATSLNLIPLGQLDGGHILYAVLGRLQRRLALGLWLGLLAVGLIWPGWILWAVITLVMGLRHPPVRDEATPLDGRRQALAWVALAIFLLSFMPLPIHELPIPALLP